MTPEDEAFEELDRRLNTKQVSKALQNLNKELEIYRNEVIEEVASRLEQEFIIPFGQDTISSFAVYIREMKCVSTDGKNSRRQKNSVA